MLPPNPPVGGITWAASPARKTRPERNPSAIRAATSQLVLDSTATSRSGTPTAARTMATQSSSEYAACVSSGGRLGASTQRSPSSSRPRTPLTRSLLTKQRKNRRSATYGSSAAWKMTFIWRPKTPCPWVPIPSPSRTVLRKPSAATRYAASTSVSSPPRTSRSTAVTPSASCS